jgi:Domain of unknown function (DUF4150)
VGCEVYANGDEIACKAGDGKVIAAFPDVCLTPPPPPAGPIPVPYPDTSFSKDMQNGSKTVQIKGQEVMLKDSSFYKTSPLGDEAATNGQGAGVVSHVITGKTYFVAWSMDVLFEGQNVDRHTDMTTSNHASPMANAQVPMGNLSKAQPSAPCAHVWEVRDPGDTKTADDKKSDLRATGNSGDAFEAKAADHNKVSDGKSMSGSDEASKLYQYCTKCGIRGSEVDHIQRDSSGKITETVECKSGNCHIKARQMNQALQVSGDIGATHKYKLEAGPGADLAEQFLVGKGFNPANIIKI